MSQLRGSGHRSRAGRAARPGPPRPGALVLLLALLLAGCGPSDAPRSAEETLRGMRLEERVAQLIVAPLPSDPDAALPRLAAISGLGGILVERGSAEAVARAVLLLQARSPVPLLVAAELDGGLGARLSGATDFPSTAALIAFAPPADTRRAAGHVAREAREIGVNLGLARAPPTNAGAPLPPPFGDLERTEAGLAAWLAGAEDEGLPVAVRTLWTAGTGAPLLDWDRARLEAIEIQLLGEMIRAGAAVVELGGARLPSLTGDSLPLPFSPAAIRGLLRRDLTWRGPVAVDLGRGSVLTRSTGAGEAAVLALAAGADLLLGPEHPDSVVAAVVAAVGEGRIPRERIDSAVRRVLALKESLPAPGTADSIPPRLRSVEAADLSRRLALATALRLAGPAGDEAPTAEQADSVLLITAAGHGATLAAELRNRVPGLRHVLLDPATDSASRAAQVAGAASWADLVLLADFPTPGGLAAPSAEAWTTVGGDTLPPRGVRVRFQGESLDLPDAAGPVLMMWGAGPASQSAAAELLLGTEAPPDRSDRLRWPPATTLSAADPAAVGMDAAALGRVDRVIEEAIDEGVFAGAALAVGRRGSLVRLRGYGRTDPGEAAALVSAESTLFDLASLSKVVGTTTAVALLVDAGRLRLDAPLQRYLPEFRGEDRAEVTIRSLLTHTSGLPSGLWLYGSAASPRQALSQVLSQPLQRAPGERMEYSDLGMILLAEAAERAAGMPLDRFLALRVFAPLGMSSTMYLPPRFLRDRIVPTAARSERGLTLRGVVHDANAFRLGGVAGHAGLFSTARDVAVFAQMILNRGSYGSLEVLSEAVATGFTRRQRGAQERALGWDTPAARSSAGQYFSADSYGHTGFTGTSLWIDPERELFVVLLTSRTFTEASGGEMLRVRADVHDAVARAVRDPPMRRRPGARR